MSWRRTLGKGPRISLSRSIKAMNLKPPPFRFPVDPYIAAIVGMVCLASILPAHGGGAVVAGYAADAAIALLFFLHGARLSPQAALGGRMALAAARRRAGFDVRIVSGVGLSARERCFRRC